MRRFVVQAVRCFVVPSDSGRFVVWSPDLFVVLEQMNASFEMKVPELDSGLAERQQHAVC